MQVINLIEMAAQEWGDSEWCFVERAPGAQMLNATLNQGFFQIQSTATHYAAQEH